MNALRLKILISKEKKQLLRDPSSILIGILLPIVLLLLIGYGMSMDIKDIKLTIVAPFSSKESNKIISGFKSSDYFQVQRVYTTREGDEALRSHQADACFYLPQDYDKLSSNGKSSILIVVNAVNATHARMVENYIKGTLSSVLSKEGGNAASAGVLIESRMWYNEANDSRYYMVPGAIVIIMSVIGTLLTALVMAREYEHGNLESMFVTPMKSSEILIAKAVNNFVLGLIGLSLSLLAARYLFDVPIRGSITVLFLISALYLIVSLCLGLLISSITKNQFLASEMTLILTFMPAFMLSGFLYEIDNMPVVIQWVTYFVPARYYVEFMQSTFNVGNVWPLIIKDFSALLAFSVIFMFLAKINNPKSLGR